MESLWPEVLHAVEKRINPGTFDRWIGQISFLDSDDLTVYLGVPSRFTRDWINDHGIKDILQQEFSTLRSRETKVVLRVLSGSVNFDPGSEPDTASSQQVSTIDRAIREAGLNPRYRFEDFVVGPSNQLAYAACTSVSENPASNYNPLFIYGGAGLGKTHLLNAIGYRIIERNPSARIIYSSTETFMNEMINSLKSKSTHRFRQKYRDKCDVLLIDDIQFLSKKTQTQEEFFHTFNNLYESHRQIVISSDSYPQEIPELEERLRTRFQWGLIADIQAPEIETRIAILQKKAETEGLDIPEDVALFIASQIKSNIREIEGSLKRLRAFSDMTGKAITLDFTKEALSETLGTKRQLTIDDVIKTVSAHYNVRVGDLRGSRRLRSVARPRQITMYICRSFLNATFPEIGRSLNKDHSTVISAVRKVESLLKSDSSVREAVEAIKRQLGL